MSAFSDYAENELLDHVLGTGSFSMPSVYVGLFTSSGGLESNTSGSWTEVSGGSYARQSASFDAASGGAASNDADIEFPEATASWGTITHFALMDAATNGNVLMWAALTADKTIGSGDTFVFKSGEIDASLA